MSHPALPTCLHTSPVLVSVFSNWIGCSHRETGSARSWSSRPVSGGMVALVLRSVSAPPGRTLTSHGGGAYSSEEAAGEAPTNMQGSIDSSILAKRSTRLHLFPVSLLLSHKDLDLLPSGI